MKKTAIRDKSHRQEVTGLVINTGKARISREWRRRVRAKIHQYLNMNHEEQGQALPGILAHLSYLKQYHPREAENHLQSILRP